MKERERIMIMLLVLVGIFFASIVIAEKKACNKPNTLAHQINWAGHNCEEPKKKKVVAPTKKVETKPTIVVKTNPPKKIEKEEEYEKSYLNKLDKIENCYEEAEDATEDWIYVENVGHCYRQELELENCYDERDDDLWKVCIEESSATAQDYIKYLNKELWTLNSETVEAEKREENEEREELKNTIREALEESEEQ